MTAIARMSSHIFAANEYAVNNNREPILTFSIDGNEFGLFPPFIMFWVQLLVGITICACFSAVMATITYTIIIPRRRSFISSLVGFGIIIPLCVVYFPFWIFNLLDVRNKLIRFCMSAIYPVLTMFHTTEAMFGFSPPSVESSYTNYVLYYVSAVEIHFDKVKNKPLISTRMEKVHSLKIFCIYLTILGLYKSIFGPCNYEPFTTNAADASKPGYHWEDLFDFYLLGNNFVSTMLLQLYLTTFIAALSALVTIGFGIKVKEGMMRNPLMKTSSPSDFWSSRWNMIVHGALKRGVFKPVYSMSSKFIAVMATFLASGLFHEYIVIACNPPHLGYEPHIGKQVAFMMWNAGIIIVEALIGHAKIFIWIKNSVPAIVVTILVLCTAMPVAHWFLHAYTHTDLYEHGELSVPMIKIMNK